VSSNSPKTRASPPIARKLSGVHLYSRPSQARRLPANPLDSIYDEDGSWKIAKAAAVKKVDITIGFQTLGAIHDALMAAGVQGATVSEMKMVRGRGSKEKLAGSQNGFVPRVRLEILVPDAMLERIMSATREAARTGLISDVKILVMDVFEIVRIRTGETGEAAI